MSARRRISKIPEDKLERMLLPDAPPRKRATRKASPERKPCIMVEKAPQKICFVSCSTIEEDVKPTISMTPHFAVSCSTIEEDVKPTISMTPRSAVSCSTIEEDVKPTISMTPRSAVDQVDALAGPFADWEDDVENDADVVVYSLTTQPRDDERAPPTSSSPSKGICDPNFEKTVEDWLLLTDSDGESDIDINNDACFLPAVSERNASAEPSTEQDLTPMAQLVLTTEDQLNDAAIRDIAQSCSFEFKWVRDRHAFLEHRETFNRTTGPTFRLHRWNPTDRDEMISFLALTILQGPYPLVEEESYFKFNGFGTMPYFRKIMSYNKYLLLRSFLHFHDNSTLTDKTKLYKIQPVTDYFNQKFSSLYNLSQEIVIDESLLKWHGRLGFAQKILSKAAQVGVKTYELCESSTGYLWKFFVYAGKDKDRPTDTDNVRNNEETNDGLETTDQSVTDSTNIRPRNATAKIVYHLVEPLLDRGHTLIMENFYNCPLLARCLKKHQTDCYGTLRLNREFVPDSLKTMTKTDLRKGEVVASYCSDLSLMVWRDANLVSTISTYHRLQVGTSQKYDRLTYKPNIALEYNKSMGGVDRKDQFLSAQPIERVKCQVWYKKLFRRLFNAALFNCYIIYHTVYNKTTHRQFRTILAEDLLKIHKKIDLTTEPRLLTRTGLIETKPRATTSRPQLEHRHFPIRTGFKQSRCWMCAQRKITSRTIWKCMECNINLCIEGCFMQYHI